MDENNFITSDQEILAEGESFFMNLYISNRNVHNLIDRYDFSKHENDAVLNDEEQNNCEGPLTERDGMPCSPENHGTGKNPWI